MLPSQPVGAMPLSAKLAESGAEGVGGRRGKLSAGSMLSRTAASIAPSVSRSGTAPTALVQPSYAADTFRTDPHAQSPRASKCELTRQHALVFRYILPSANKPRCLAGNPPEQAQPAAVGRGSMRAVGRTDRTAGIPSRGCGIPQPLSPRGTPSPRRLTPAARKHCPLAADGTTSEAR